MPIPSSTWHHYGIYSAVSTAGAGHHRPSQLRYWGWILLLLLSPATLVGATTARAAHSRATKYPTMHAAVVSSTSSSSASSALWGSSSLWSLTDHETCSARTPFLSLIQPEQEPTDYLHDRLSLVKRSATTWVSSRQPQPPPLLVRGGAAASVPPSPPSTSSGLISFWSHLIDTVANSKTQCWTLLILSILAETMATSLSKRARDVRSLALFVTACGLYLVCMAGFNISLSKIEVGIAYSVWSALGTFVVSTVGILLFGESYDAYKIGCLLMIIAGVVGLNLRGGH